MRTNFARTASVVAALASNACVTRATEVTVFVDTDAPRRVVVMRTFVSRGSARSSSPDTHRWTRTGAPTDFVFPASFGVIPGGASLDEPVFVEVEVDLSPRSPGQPSVTLRRAARFRFTSHTPTVVRLFIPISCSADVAPLLHCLDSSSPCTISRYCDENGTTCGDEGQCIGVDVRPTEDAGTYDARRDTCTPRCEGRTCGNDGCGGSCGTCAVDAICDPSNRCVPRCTPNCAGRQCGSDSCSGSCGTCAASTRCDDATGACVCVPNCTGRACGDDGCGGSCGTCGSGTSCNTVSGACEAVCTPNCSARTCGTDGCGGACGTCASGSLCNATSGQCFACNAGAPCATGNECKSGTVICTTTAAMCQPTPLPNGTGCSIGACSGGSCVCSPRGCDWYGECGPTGMNPGTLHWEFDGCGGQIYCGACCAGGSFCGATNLVTEWSCGCGNPPAGSGWVDQGGDCWHRFVDPPQGC